MFDYLRCEYPLPVEGANDIEYQTKDTGEQSLLHYVLRKDGSLWFKDDNGQWIQEIIVAGEVRFGSCRDNRDIEFSAYFVEGKLKELHLIWDRKINEVMELKLSDLCFCINQTKLTFIANPMEGYEIETKRIIKQYEALQFALENGEEIRLIDDREKK